MNKYSSILLCAVLLLFFQQTTYGATFTSVQSGDWDDGATWGNTSPGIQGTDWPATTDDVVIASGHTVTLTGNETIDFIVINSGGIFDYDGNTLTVTTTASVVPFISSQTGNFSANGTWLNGSSPGTTDRAIVAKGHTVTANNTTIADLTIDAGAVLNTANNKDITVTSNLVVNGTLLLEKAGDDLIFSTGPVTLSGSGTIDGALAGEAINLNVATTLSSGADLTIFNNVAIANGITFTITGALIVSGGDITGGNASSQVTMGTDGSLEIDGVLLTTGILDASTNSGNTVEYNGSVAQTIKSPSSNTYTNLTVSGTGTKTFPANALTLEGNLNVTAGTLDVNSQNITIEGNWINSATISNLSTVTFSNTSAQSVTTNATTFVNLTINKSSETITLNEDVVVTGTLTMTQGDIDTGSNSLTLGSGAEGTFTYTAGRIIGTFGQYIGASTTTAFDYPIGTSGNGRTVAITFDQTGGGRQAGVVLAQFVETDPGGSGFPVTDDVTLYNAFNEGYWNFTVNGFSKGNSNSFDLSLTGNGFSSFTIGSNTRLLQRDDSGTNWAADGAHGSVTSNTITRNNITTFVSQFCFADDTNCTGPSDPVFSASVTEVCTSDTNDTYTVTLNSGNTYQWTVVGGTIDGQTNPTGFVSNLNSIDVDWGSTGQVGSVSVQENDPTCTSSNIVTLDVNINSIAPATISGSTLVAESSTGIAYSVTNDANTTYNWTITGGTQASGTTTNSITVDWGSNGAGIVAVTATKTSPSCSASASTQLAVTKYIVVDSDLTAVGCDSEWQTAACWATGSVPLASESVRIESGQTMTLQNNQDVECANLIVDGTLNFDNETVTVSGDLTINSGGSLTGISGGILEMTGSLSSPQNQIDGTGSLNGAFTLEIKTASKTIASSAVINQAAGLTVLNIDAGLTVTNEGSIEIGGAITGDAASSTWTNSTNSTLTAGGAMLATGTLDASASGNTVVYNSTTAADIKVSSSGYQNLEVQDGTKTIAASIDVNDGFTLTSGTLAMGVNNMTVAGDLTYTAGTLTASTGIITLDGTTNQIINGAWTIPNLTINNATASGDAITFNSPVTVSTALALTDGVVGTTSLNLLRMSTTTAPTGFSDASFINGPMVYDAVTSGTLVYPVGKSDSLHRVDLTVTSSSSNFQAEFLASNAQNLGYTLPGSLDKVSFVSYWTISSTVSPVTSAAVQLYYIYSDGVTDQGNLRVAKDDGASNWVDLGGTGSASRVGSITSNNFTTFSDFALAEATGGTNPLPVNLIYFKAVLRADGIVSLDWATASELNNDYFEIQKSLDGVNFSTIGKENGHGTVNEEIRYSFIDESSNVRQPYYRLKQIDFDGVFEYSEVIRVDMLTNQVDWVIYPNPTGGSVTFSTYQEIDANNTIVTIIDLAGKKVSLPTKMNSSGIKLDMYNLQPGVYIVIIRNNQSKSIHRIVRK